MATLNVEVPAFDCLLRKEYLYDNREHHGEFERVTVFGVTSILGRAVGFWVLVHSTGACVARLPVSSLVHRDDAPDLDLEALELWDCFSYEVSCWTPKHMTGRSCLAVLKDGTKHKAESVLILDWHDSAYAENAGPSGWKCAHLLALDNGCYALQPNNRILWADPATIDRPFEVMPDYKIQTQEWSVEHLRRWTTGDDYFYEVNVEPEGGRRNGAALTQDART